MPSSRSTPASKPTIKPAAASAPPIPAARDLRQTSPIYMSASWQAGPPPAAASTSTARPTSARAEYNTGNATATDDVRCKCNAPAAQKTVVSEIASKGKKFWKCETGGCSFFQWVEDVPTSRSGSTATVPTKRPFSEVS